MIPLVLVCNYLTSFAANFKKNLIVAPFHSYSRLSLIAVCAASSDNSTVKFAVITPPNAPLLPFSPRPTLSWLDSLTYLPWLCWTMSSRLQTSRPRPLYSIVDRSSAQSRHHPPCRRVCAEQQQRGLSETTHMRWIIWLDKHAKPGPPLAILHATSCPAKWYWQWRAAILYCAWISCSLACPQGDPFLSQSSS